MQYFRNQFHQKLHNLGLHDQHDKTIPYERAEMRQWWLYYSWEFRDFLKELSVYQEYILEIAAELARDKQFEESVAQACDEAVDWIQDEAHRIRCARRVLEIQQQFRHDVYNNFTWQREWVDDDTRIFYEDCEAYDNSRFVKRAQAETEIKRGEIHYTQRSYTLSKEAAALLRTSDVHSGYHFCYGNQLQQVIHQECVDLIERTAQLKQNSPIFEYQPALVYCIEAAHTYNKVGLTHNASIVADFCYTLLDYGKAILEGARDGLLGVAQQAINDPLQTVASATLSIAAGEYMLAYQLGKIVYGVLNLTVNAVINPGQAQKTWDGYVEPISGLIDALKNKQLSLHDGIRAGTALAVSMKAQSMLAKGCEKLYSVTKTRALAYITKNPLAHPEQYMTTPEGASFSIISESARKKKSRNIPEPSSKELLGKLSDDAVQQALEYAKIENNFAHYFQLKHKLGDLVKQLGGKENFLKAVIESSEGHLPASGVFMNIPIQVAGSTVWIRGRVIDGVPKFSSIFIR